MSAALDPRRAKVELDVAASRIEARGWPGRRSWARMRASSSSNENGFTT